MRYLLVLSSLLLAACGNYHIDKASDPTNAIQGVPDGIDYEVVKADVFQPYCVRCHGAGRKVDLTQYATIKAHLGDISDQVVSSQMPQSGSMPDGLRNELLTWIEAGAPESLAADGAQ